MTEYDHLFEPDPSYPGSRATTGTVLCMDERHRHAHRFRKVSDRYERRVAESYDRDSRAMADADDDVVAATVAAWKKGRRLKATDWQALKGI